MRVPQSVTGPRLVAELAVVGPGSHPGQGQCVNDPDGRNHGEYRGKPPVSPHRAPGNHQRGEQVGAHIHHKQRRNCKDYCGGGPGQQYQQKQPRGTKRIYQDQQQP